MENSSTKLLSSQTVGHNYEYDARFEEYRYDTHSQDLLSVSTNDYMSFSTSLTVMLVAFILINLA